MPIGMAGLCAIYFVAGKLSLRLAFVNESTTAVWPPTGIAIAALILWGHRYWPAIFLGALLVNYSTSGLIAPSLGIAFGNTLEGLLAAYLVNRFCNSHALLATPMAIVKFVLVAVIISPMASAFCGVTSLCLSGLAQWHNYNSIWPTWWIGDGVGALIIAPFLILWQKNPRISWDRIRLLEALLLFIGLVVTAEVVFRG